MAKKRLGFDLILLGDSASGKDTHALLLAKKFSVKLVRSGEYLRRLKGFRYRHGKAAPSNVIIPFLNYSLKTKSDLVFVGAGRLKPEAEYLVKQLKKKNRDFFAIYIKLPKQEIIKRSNLRAQRLEDSDLNLINSRIAYFKKNVNKTVEFYQKLHKLKFINGKQTINKVSKDILKAIHDYQRSGTN